MHLVIYKYIVYVYKFVCICIHISIHRYIYIYICIYLSIHVYAYAHLYVNYVSTLALERCCRVKAVARRHRGHSARSWSDGNVEPSWAYANWTTRASTSHFSAWGASQKGMMLVGPRYMWAYLYMCVYMYMQMYIFRIWGTSPKGVTLGGRKYMYVCIYVYVNIYIYIYIFMYTFVYSQCTRMFVKRVDVGWA